MKTNYLFPFTETSELNLISVFKSFRLYGCTYMYYTINDLNMGRLRFSTNDDWMKVYLEDDLILDDPVKLFCEQKISRIISWKNIPVNGLRQKKTMECRKSFGIYNGLNVIHYDQNTGLQKILALCTDQLSHDLPRELINSHQTFKQDLINIFNL